MPVICSEHINMEEGNSSAFVFLDPSDSIMN